jgi:N-acetylglutamate synthase-like GNAT family acetyltransferase
METVRQATKQDYREMIRLGNLCFTRPYDQYGIIEQRWCHAWGGHLKDPSENYIKNFFVIERRRKIIGMIAVIPMVLEWHGSKIPAGGITAVATHPDYRNRGVMSTLMSFADEKMRAEPYMISLLGGDRGRYAHFGWEQVGLRGEMRYSAGYLRAIPDSSVSPIQIYPEDDLYLDNLIQLTASARVKLARSKNQLEVILRRPRVEFWAYKKGSGLSSYIAAFDNRVWEYQGVAAEITALIKYFGLSHGYEEVHVATPSVFNTNEEELYRWTGSFALMPMVFLKILRFKELVKKLLPGIREKAKQKRIAEFKITLVIEETQKAVTLVIGSDQISVSDEQSNNRLVLPGRSMSRLLFGPRSEGILLDSRIDNQPLMELLPLNFSFSWIDMV